MSFVKELPLKTQLRLASPEILDYLSERDIPPSLPIAIIPMMASIFSYCTSCKKRDFSSKEGAKLVADTIATIEGLEYYHIMSDSLAYFFSRHGQFLGVDYDRRTRKWKIDTKPNTFLHYYATLTVIAQEAKNLYQRNSQKKLVE